MERKIIAAFMQNRNAWDLAKDHVTEHDLSPEGALILQEIGEFYDNDSGASRCDREILAERVKRKLQSARLATAVVQVISGLPEDVSGINVAREIVALKSHRVGLELASLLAAGKSGPEVERLIDAYSSLQRGGEGGKESSEEGVSNDLNVRALLSTAFDPSGLIQLWPDSLNRHIDGGAKPGHHILIFAPTEMGKSLFAINAVAGFLRQSLPVLYIGNEDPAADLIMRVISRLTGLNKYEVMEQPDKAQELLDKRNYKLLTLAALAPGNFRRISQLVDQYNPKVVVLDQLRNIDVDSENRTQALEKAATEARNLAKRRQVLVASVTQAADSASGKRILARGDVDGSNVGIPGQCDLMVGLGADEEMERQNIRMLSFPKNKLSGKHEPITVTIDPLLSKVIDHA
jgi:archaellum biogenesis ATPase FlaH